MSSGNIVEIIGAVVDTQFPRAAVPKVCDALKVENSLTLELCLPNRMASGMGHVAGRLNTSS